MGSVSGFTFDNMSRIGNDSCNLDQNTIQNMNASNYYYRIFFRVTVP